MRWRMIHRCRWVAEWVVKHVQERWSEHCKRATSSAVVCKHVAEISVSACLSHNCQTVLLRSTRCVSRRWNGRSIGRCECSAFKNSQQGQLLSAANMKFALDLYKRFTSPSGRNVFMSPLRISTALTMTYLGARGQTRSQMKDVLHYTDVEEDQLHQAFADIQSALKTRTTIQAVHGKPAVWWKVVHISWRVSCYWTQALRYSTCASWFSVTINIIRLAVW